MNFTWAEMLSSGELELGACDGNQWTGQVAKDGSASLPVELTEDVVVAEGRMQVDCKSASWVEGNRKPVKGMLI